MIAKLDDEGNSTGTSEATGAVDGASAFVDTGSDAGTGITIGSGSAEQMLTQIRLTTNPTPAEQAELARQAIAIKTTEDARRKDFRSVIQKGDYFAIKDNQKEALRYYLIAYMRLGSDAVLASKIGGLYFDMKKFDRAYDYLSKINPNIISPEDKNRILLSLIYTRNPAIATELTKLNLHPETSEYYAAMYQCLGGISACVGGIQSYTGTAPVLQSMLDVINNYATVSNDIQYRNIRLAGIAFEQKQYSVAATIASEVATARPDYIAALQIAGFSYYELGDYTNSKNYFAKLYTYTPKDIQVAYLLGNAYFHLGDYSMSNLYFNAAVLNGYTPKSEIERRLVYNNYVLGDMKNTNKVLRYLLAEPDATVDDYNTAAWLSISQNDIARASLWARNGRAKFPNNDTIVAFTAWVYRLQKNATDAKTAANQALTINPHNPIALLQLGILAYDAGDRSGAESYFENVESVDHNGVFSLEAAKYIDLINTTNTATGTVSLSGTIQ